MSDVHQKAMHYRISHWPAHRNSTSELKGISWWRGLSGFIMDCDNSSKWVDFLSHYRTIKNKPQTVNLCLFISVMRTTWLHLHM